MVYRKERLHQDADLLSSNPNGPVTVNQDNCVIPVYSCFVPILDNTAQLIYEQQKDEICRNFRELLTCEESFEKATKQQKNVCDHLS